MFASAFLLLKISDSSHRLAEIFAELFAAMENDAVDVIQQQSIVVDRLLIIGKLRKGKERKEVTSR